MSFMLSSTKPKVNRPIKLTKIEYPEDYVRERIPLIRKKVMYLMKLRPNTKLSPSIN